MHLNMYTGILHVGEVDFDKILKQKIDSIWISVPIPNQAQTCWA